MAPDKDFSDFVPDEKARQKTRYIMLAGLAAALFLNLPLFSLMAEFYWPVVQGGVPMILANGLSYFITFFHELGHSITGWFYGYPTIPMFDFKHGGGWAYQPVGQQIILLIAIWAVMLYAIFVFLRGYKFLQGTVLVLLLFNIATAFMPLHRVMFDFMGPVAPPLMGTFFLYRALFDLAPRGNGERFLNSLFGFALPLHAMIEGFGLLYNDMARTMYWNQKSAHGIGDLDKIAGSFTSISFSGIVVLWIITSLLCLMGPFLLYLRRQDI